MEWSHRYYSEFELDKLQLIDFTRRLQTTSNPPPGKKTSLAQGNPITLNNTTVRPCQQARYLGVLLDPQLTFRAHFAQALARGQRSVDGLRRLTNTKKGVPAHLGRKLYKTVIIPRMLYAVDVVCGPPKANCSGAKGLMSKLARKWHQTLAISETVLLT